MSKRKPRIVQITPRVYGLISMKTSVYAITTEQGVILIDTGLPQYMKYITAFLQSFGKSVAEVTDIFVTHADGDHIGGLAKIVQISQARVFLSQLTHEHLQRSQNPKHFPWPLHVLASIGQRLFIKSVDTVEYVVDNQSIKCGDIEIVCLQTPGHTKDHMAYVIKELGVVFAGDNLFYKQELELTPQWMTYDPEVLRTSIEKIIALHPEYICAGHGTKVWQRTIDGEESLLKLRSGY